jgi:hypothetical protein
MYIFKQNLPKPLGEFLQILAKIKVHFSNREILEQGWPNHYMATDVEPL